MNTTNTTHFLKNFLNGLLPRAGRRPGDFFPWVAALLCISAAMSVRGVPVVNNNDGYFFDQYQDNLGIFSVSQVRIAPPGTVSLTPLNNSGNYRTLEIVPTSFDQWGQLEVIGSYGAVGDLMVEVLDRNGIPLVPPFPPQPVNGPISLASLNSPLVPGIRVKVYFNQTAAVAPTVDSLRVTWRPISRLLLDKQAPAQVQAGGKLLYSLRYSVSYVRAKDLVVWDTLPSYPGSLTYPPQVSPTPYSGQNDAPIFISATKGGMYTSGGLVVNGVNVPANSVYWVLGDVPEGVTDVLTFILATRNGTLDMTTVANRGYAHAANASPAQSQQVVTAIRSAPGPFVDKKAGFGIYDINGQLQTIAGSINNFDISAGNSGTETMYKSVLYDDLSGLVNFINDPVNDIFNISPPGGVYNPSFDPDGPGGSPPFPAIVWNVGTLPPGGSFAASFSAQLSGTPPQPQYNNRACLISDQTSPFCDQLLVKVGLDNGTGSGPGGATFRKSASPLNVPYGGIVQFDLSMRNKFAVKLNDIVILDKVPANITFRSAWINDPDLIASGAKIFYSTSVLFTDPNIPPPVDYTQAPTDLDVSPNNYWEPYPPPNPAIVTWVAFFFPQVDSTYLPNFGTPAFPPSTPITAASGSFDANVSIPANPCIDSPVPNHALFRAYEITDLNNIRQPNPDGTLATAADASVTAKPYKGQLYANSFIAPDVLTVPGSSTYSLTVGNDSSATSKALFPVEAVIHLSQVAVNGVLEWPSVQGIPPGGTYASGTITVPLGLLAPGASTTIQIQLGLPAGIVNQTEYTLSATITGQDDLCGSSIATDTARGYVLAGPKLQVFKQPIVDLIPSGSEYDYSLDYVNLGTGPSTGTYLVDRIPDETVFVSAYANPNVRRVWFSADDNLPPQTLTPLTPIDATTINNHFSWVIPPNNGICTSPFGEATHWIAFEVDDPALVPPQLAISVPRTVGFRVRNDKDPGPAVVGSTEGTRLPNAAAIFSSELLQAIGNQVITTVKDQPSIIVEKTGPSVVEAGVPFDWVVNYYNNSLTPANDVVVTDTLPPGIIFLGATHTWNSAALANGATVNNSGQPVPASVVNNLDGSTTLTFIIAGSGGYRGPGAPLIGLEGGTITVNVKSDSAACGSTRINTACGTASSATETVTSCASHQVNIFCPDLELTKFVAPTMVLAGGNLTYQIIVNNHGAGPAREVSLVDTLPAGVSYVPGSLSVATLDYTLGPPFISGQTLTWDVAHGNAITHTGLPQGTVPPKSGNILIQFTVQVDANVPGCTTLNNMARVSTVSIEEGTNPNSANASATVPPPELVVAKSGPALARPGNRVSWNVTWANQSPQGATGVYLVDTLPNNDADPNSDVSFISVATPAGITPYYNASPCSPVPVFDPSNPLLNGWSATPTIPVNHIALLVGTLAGNAGPFTAQVTVDLIDPNGGSPVLPPPGVCFTNSVVIRQAVPLCENTANNTATAVVCTPALDLALTKTASAQGSLPGIAPGTSITYTLAFENSGTVNAYGVSLTDTLAASLVPGNPLDNFTVVTLVDSGGSPVSPVDPVGNPITGVVPVTRQISGSTITWYLGTTTPSDPLYYKKVGLPRTAHGSFQLYVTVADSLADNTEVCNSASVAAAPDVGTEDLLDNNTSKTCVTVRRADLAIMKSGVEAVSGDPDFVEFGNQITYTIKYNNLGSLTAENVVIHEIVPTGSSLVGVNLPPGATVTYSPNQAGANSFDVTFDKLSAPANWVGVPSKADATAPTFVSIATDCTNNIVTVTFSERMDSVKATTLGNYQLSGGVTILNAVLSADGRTVTLFTSALSSSYVLTMANLTDFAGNTLPTATATAYCAGATDCCANCQESDWVTNTVHVPIGLGIYLVNPLCHGTNNTLAALLPDVDAGTIVTLVKNGGLVTYIFDDVDLIWAPDGNATIEPGEGFWFKAPATGTKSIITWTGCIPDCPRPCAPITGITNLVGGFGFAPAYYSNLYSCPPACGTQVGIPNGGTVTNFTFLNGVWIPREPVIPPGRSAFVTVLPNTNCVSTESCLGVDSNGVYEAFGIANPNGFLGWGTLFVDDVIPSGTHIEYSVGRLVGSTPVYDLGPLYTSVSIGQNGLDLSGINPSYTSLVLRAQYFGITVDNATILPCLRGWKMTYHSSEWPSFTFTVRVDGRGADGCGPLPIDNVVTISTTTPEITLDNNTASYHMQTRLTDLAVQMSVDKSAALPTQTLTYQLQWLVAGPQSAPNSYLRVVLPDGDGNGSADVTLGTVTPGPGVTAYYNTASTLSSPVFNPSSPTANGWTTSPVNANHIVFLLGDLAPNSAGNITYTAVVKTGSDGRTFLSTVVGVTSRRETDCDNADSALTYVGTLANVYVEKTGPGCVHPGDLATFTIKYGNNGNGPAASVVVADALPPGLTFVSSIPAPTGAGPTWNNLGAIPGTLAAGESGVITVVAQLANNYGLIGQTLVNVANISTTSGEVNLADNRAQAVLDCITANLVSLSGFVYQDHNGNGLRELGSGETGLSGVTVTLNGLDIFNSVITLTTTTDQNGQYNFIGINPGTYTLTETQPATWLSTADTIGTVNLLPRGSNPNPLDDVLGPITLNGGENGVEYNFGEGHMLLACATNKTVECGSVWTFDEPTARLACCANVTVTILGTITNSTGPCSLMITRTWRAVDCCSNTATCNQVVTVVDTTPPVLTCAPAKTVECGSAWTFDNPSAVDACCVISPTVTVLSTITNSTGPCSQTITRSWKANDCCNNSATCSQVVTVVDTTPPVITCAPAKTVECGSAWSFDDPSAVDACCIVSPTVTLLGTITNGAGTCSQTITRTWKATDCCNNSATCSQVVTVVDTTPPVITCAPAKTVECGSAWSFDDPSAVDACCIISPTVTVLGTTTNNAGPCSLTITRTWKATDCCNNSATCSQVVTVVDTTPPVVTCAPAKTVECGTAWTFDDPSAVDACCVSSPRITILGTATNSAGPCLQTLTRTWKVTDCCNNSATCSQVVTVTDTTPPVLTCAPARTVECGSAWSFDAPGAIDACCSAPTITILGTTTNSIGPCSQVITRTWQATDCCNNSATCSQVITVTDTTPPVINCTPARTVECGSTWSFDAPSAVDACCSANPTITVLGTTTNSTGPCSQAITRTWQATDCCNNSSTCSQVITVTDTTPPVITCAPAKTVECGSAWSFNTPSAVDACCSANPTIAVLGTATNSTGLCSQVITRTWQATDCCNNSSTCSQAITVVDTTAPVLSGCQPICTNTINGNNGVIVRYAVTAMDNCDGPVAVTYAPPSGSFLPIGQTVVTCSALDHCGNSNGCQFTVTVTVPVSATVPGNQVVCEGTTVNFCTVASGTGPYTYQWSKEGVVLAGQTTSCLAINNATANNAGFYCVVVQGPCTAVTNCATLKMGSCGQTEFCGMTQGFYGNSKGKFNGTPSLTLMTSMLTPNLVVGKTGVRSLTIPASAASLLQQRMPSGGSPATLPNSSDQTLATAVLPLDSKGKFVNVLLGQTITLSLNVRLSPQLLAFSLPATFCTVASSPGTDGQRGTTDDAQAGDYQSFNIPASVLSALVDTGLGINNNTVQGLLQLANRALAGQSIGSATLSDVNAAVDAINQGFDNCRILVACDPHLLIAGASSDSFGGPPVPPMSNPIYQSESSSLVVSIGACDYRTRASSLNATKQPGEPDIAGNRGGKSLWWTWMPTTSGLATITTDGSSFDTLLGVYTGSSISNLTLVASNDDYNGQVASQVTFFAQAGTNYQIAVDGFDAASGMIQLTVLVFPSRLGPPVLLPNNRVQLRIEGGLGCTYTIEASSDMINWTPISSVDNTMGILEFADPAIQNSNVRFYRTMEE